VFKGKAGITVALWGYRIFIAIEIGIGIAIDGSVF
jgi:hypothetical protein